MEARKEVIRNIFSYENPKEDLIYDIANEFLFENENWIVDIFDLLESDEDWRDEELEDVKYNIKNNDYIVYYDRKEEPLLIAFDEEDYLQTFIECIKAFGKTSFLMDKKELLGMINE